MLTTEGLLLTTPQGDYEPRLAETWSISPDGLTVKIQLREGVSFHDRVELNADVVTAFLDRARTDPRQLQNYPALADIQSIDTLSRYELRLNLVQPSALIEDALSIGIEREAGGRQSGTGPYALSSDTEGQMTFVANRDYHRGPPFIDIVTLTTYPNHRAAWVAMMRNEIDFLFEVPISAQDFVEAESTVDLYSIARPYAFSVAFNVSQPTLAPTEVRQALNYAVDRRAVVDRALAGNSRPSSGISARHWAYGGIRRVYRYDPLLADEMLTRAGFPLPEGRQTRDTEDMPVRLRFSCLVPSDVAPFETIALVVQRQLHAVGVDMTLESVDFRSLARRVESGEWDAVLVPQNTGRTPARLYSMWHSSEPLAAVNGYSAADDVLDSLRHAVSRQEVAAATAAFQQILYDDPPAIFIAEARQARAVSRRFEIPAPAPGIDIIETLWQWRRADPVP